MLQTLGTLPDPMLLDGDTPRARTTDPLTSHRAADRSQASLPSVRVAVLRVVDNFVNLTGQELNAWYRRDAENGSVPMVAYESPRRRAGELAVDGYLTADRTSGVEAVYSLTDAGRVYLEQVSA